MAKLNMVLLTKTSLMLVACLCLANDSVSAASKLVRINLFKEVLQQHGDLKQPQISYYVNINVGTPAKRFKMLVDLNAREIWLPHYSRLGLICTRLNYKEGYCKKDSSTSVKEEHDLYTTCYRGSELSGKAYLDTFEIANVAESLEEVKFKQRFLAISNTSNDKFCKFGVDGVIALNPWPISETGSDLITVALSRANLIGELKFALALNNSEETNDGGELTFGGVNPSKYLGALSYHKVLTQHAWDLKLRSVMLGAEPIATPNDESTALISTSSNDIYGPARFVERILKLLGLIGANDHYKEGQLYEIDCLKVVSAPTLTFVIDDAYYLLQPVSYIKKMTEGLVFKSTVCYVSILSNGSTNRWELGTNFVSNYYTVFDMNQRQIAFGTRTRN